MQSRNAKLSDYSTTNSRSEIWRLTRSLGTTIRNMGCKGEKQDLCKQKTDMWMERTKEELTVTWCTSAWQSDSKAGNTS